MITPAQIERIAKLLAGDHPGWQARFVKLTGISRSQVSYLINGDRNLTAGVARKIVDAARKEAAAMQTRAAEIDAVIELLLETPIEI
jgi:hypothetical protein